MVFIIFLRQNESRDVKSGGSYIDKQIHAILPHWGPGIPDGTDILFLRQVKAADAAFYRFSKDETVRYAIEDVLKWIDGVIAPGGACQ